MGLLDALISGAGSFLSADAKKNALESSIPNPTKYSGLETGQQDFTRQGAKLTDIAALLGSAADIDSEALQSRIAGIDSALLARLKASDAIATSASKGELPPEVLRKLKANADYRAFQGGSFGSSLQSNAQKKDIELARLKRRAEAPALAADALQDSQSLVPEFADVASTLISPAAITARRNAEEEYNANLGNQQSAINSQIGLANSNALYGGIARGLGGILAYADSRSTKIPATSSPGATNYSSLGG